jgi:3'(2'), 5'-bisphosphate nucleotidase
LADESHAWLRLHVSQVHEPEYARMLRSVEKSHTDTGGIAELATELSITAEPVPMDSQAKYAVLAAGGGEILLRLLSPSRPDYREMIWDQAAGSIVIEEAGGRITDLDGKDLDFSRGRTLAANRGVLATNGHLHDVVLNGLRAIKVAKLPEPERWA